jgi:hypothetical protein
MNLFKWMAVRSGTAHRLSQIEARLDEVLSKEQQIMALGQDILDKVTVVETKVGSFIALIEALIADNTIPADIGAAILAKVAGTEAALDAAIAANTPVTP